MILSGAGASFSPAGDCHAAHRWTARATVRRCSLREANCPLRTAGDQCHLCGRWFRQLGSSHVLHAHGMTAAEYRVLAGLRPRHPLQAPDLSAARAARLRRRITTDARLIGGMAAGVALARNGALQRKADEALRAGPVALERERQLAVSGARLGSARAAAYRQRREQRALALGFAGLEDFYRSRYVLDRVRIERLAAELGCAESAVRKDLQRLGLGPDHTRSHGARWRQST